MRFARACVAGGLVASIPFLMVLWNFRLRPLRTAVTSRIFSNFYDLQARALMHGHLDVPKGALSIEAFRVGDRDYMYFPPLPALLRMPFLAITDTLDGRLTAPSMLVAWLLVVTFTALLLWRVRCMIHPGSPLGRREAFAYGVLVAVIAGGSVLVFVASLPWVFHEAYMWSTAMAIGSVYGAVGVLERPTAGRVCFAGVAALGCVLSRTTAGWACCLMLIVAAGAILVQPRYRSAREWSICVFASGAIPLAIGAAINWAKFHHPFMFPLENQVWTAVNEHRRQALAANGGGLTGPQFFTSSLVNYFRPNGIRFTSAFPFITLPAQPARSVGGAFLDQTYRTGSVPAFMPLLFGLSLWGVFVTFRRRAADGIARLRIPVLGAVAITAGVMFYGYIAHRYTAEFLPALVVLSAVGLVDRGRPSSALEPPDPPYFATGGLVLLAGFGVIANTAIGASSARVTEGGRSLKSFVDTRMRVSQWFGAEFAGSVEHASTLDGGAPADRIRIVGDCDAVYLATGDQYQPWVPVDVRGVSLDIMIGGLGAAGRMPLVHFDGGVERTLVLDHDGRGNYRLVMEGGTSNYEPGDWYPFPSGASFTVDVGPNADGSAYVVNAPAQLYATVPLMDWNRDWIGVPSRPRIDVPARLQQELGARVSVRWHEPSSFCREVGEAAGE